MQRVRHKLVLGGVLAAAAVWCAVVIETSERPKFDLSLARVVDVRDTNTLSSLDFRFPIEDTNEDWVVVMRVHNSGSRPLMFGQAKVQCRVRGRWLAPEDVSWLNNMHFVAQVACRSDAEFVVAVVPRETESVRMILEYHYQSLPDRWYNLAGYYSASGYTRLPKGMAWTCAWLRSPLLDPLWRRSYQSPWPSVTQEFTLPMTSPRMAREHNQSLQRL